MDFLITGILMIDGIATVRAVITAMLFGDIFKATDNGWFTKFFFMCFSFIYVYYVMDLLITEDTHLFCGN